jgi:hypothetical protein
MSILLWYLNYLLLLFRVPGNFMSVLQDLVSQNINIQKCRMNISPIVNYYGATDVLNSG